MMFRQTKSKVPTDFTSSNSCCAQASKHSLRYLCKLGTQISHLCLQAAFLIQNSIEFCFASMEEDFKILNATLSNRQICIFLFVAETNKSYHIYTWVHTHTWRILRLQLQMFWYTVIVPAGGSGVICNYSYLK